MVKRNFFGWSSVNVAQKCPAKYYSHSLECTRLINPTRCMKSMHSPLFRYLPGKKWKS
uniref:Uncharacterized protein n=1 Tax=Picea glauca TaxID=3330 RepID=A0A124GMR3_PICGL|nr:hypothetical protein ABT39_MTgene1559 [Picea glauca]